MTAINTQAQTPKTNSASVTQKIQAVPNGDDCEVCNKRLEKVLNDLDTAESAIKSLQSEIEARRRLDDLNDQIIKAKDAVISEQAKLIEILQKQNKRKITILFGLVKIRF